MSTNELWPEIAEYIAKQERKYGRPPLPAGQGVIVPNRWEPVLPERVPSVIRQAIDLARKIMDEGTAKDIQNADVSVTEIERVAGASRGLDLKEHNAVSQARELTFAAGCPLRDRYGYTARDKDVLKILEILKEWNKDEEAGLQIGLANAVGEIEIAMQPDIPADEEYELAIVAALRGLEMKLK